MGDSRPLVAYFFVYFIKQRVLGGRPVGVYDGGVNVVVVDGWGRGIATRAGILVCDFTAMSMLFFSGIINNMEKAQ